MAKPKETAAKIHHNHRTGELALHIFIEGNIAIRKVAQPGSCQTRLGCRNAQEEL